MSKACPNCGGIRIGEGEVPGDLVFRPGTLRSFTFVMENGVTLTSRYFWACLDCGHFWGSINPVKLREFIVNHGNRDTQAKWCLTKTDENAWSRPANLTTGCQTLSDRVQQLANDPSTKIEAIKAYMDETSASLAEAKGAIDEFLNGRQ